MIPAAVESREDALELVALTEAREKYCHGAWIESKDNYTDALSILERYPDPNKPVIEEP